jgi:hypothetical protein
VTRLLQSGLAFVASMLIGVVGVSAQQQPVVLELYTSQGCAACPPADILMEQLADRDDVIALALHVDYWDYIGWADSFGQAAFSARQKSYARARGRASVFTPQMIVAGIDEVKGSAEAQIRAKIDAHKADPFSRSVSLSLTEEDAQTLRLTAVAQSALAYATDVFLVRYRDRAEVEILGGENAGRNITYRNIVTDWDLLARWDGVASFRTLIPKDGSDGLVVIVQEQGYGPILNAVRWR